MNKVFPLLVLAGSSLLAGCASANFEQQTVTLASGEKLPIAFAIKSGGIGMSIACPIGLPVSTATPVKNAVSLAASPKVKQDVSGVADANDIKTAVVPQSQVVPVGGCFAFAGESAAALSAGSQYMIGAGTIGLGAGYWHMGDKGGTGGTGVVVEQTVNNK